MAGKKVPSYPSFWLAVIPALLGLCLMSFVGYPLTQNATTPRGILDLELPFTSARIMDILMAWKPSLTNLAIQHTMIDFLFIAVYGFCFIYLYRWVAFWRGGSWQKLAKLGPRIVLGIAVLDVLENTGILMALYTGHGNSFSAAGITAVSAIKWLLVAWTILFLAGAKFIGAKHESEA